MKSEGLPLFHKTFISETNAAIGKSATPQNNLIINLALWEVALSAKDAICGPGDSIRGYQVTLPGKWISSALASSTKNHSPPKGKTWVSTQIEGFP